MKILVGKSLLGNSRNDLLNEPRKCSQFFKNSDVFIYLVFKSEAKLKPHTMTNYNLD